tara:strand:- start:4326 stop:4565 length:240 start_codon:yes stop_codon:yes gene_type:complete
MKTYKELIHTVYFVEKKIINKGDLIYDNEKSIIGYFTGFGTNHGYIECENCNGNTYFVSGFATYIEGFGLKLNKDYKII